MKFILLVCCSQLKRHIVYIMKQAKTARVMSSSYRTAHPQRRPHEPAGCARGDYIHKSRVRQLMRKHQTNLKTTRSHCSLGQLHRSVDFCPTVSHNQDFVGNGWHDVERNFTVRRRMTDALIMLRHIFQEWIAPVGDDGLPRIWTYEFPASMEVEGSQAPPLLEGSLPGALGGHRVYLVYFHDCREVACFCCVFVIVGCRLLWKIHRDAWGKPRPSVSRCRISQGNVEAFSYRQLIDIEAWVALLIRRGLGRIRIIQIISPSRRPKRETSDQTPLESQDQPAEGVCTCQCCV